MLGILISEYQIPIFNFHIILFIKRILSYVNTRVCYIRRAVRAGVQGLDREGVDTRRQGQMRKRGQFMIKGPNRVWPIDGYDRLARFGFYIYASIDTYCRYIVWYYIGHSNWTAVSDNKQYLSALTTRNNFPKLIQSDKGGETVLLCNSDLVLCRVQKPELPSAKSYSYRTLTWTKNQQIESWWNLLANSQTEMWRNLCVEFEKYDYFDGGDIDVIYLQYIYMKMIRTQAQIFHQQKNHFLRTDRAPSGRIASALWVLSSRIPRAFFAFHLLHLVHPDAPLSLHSVQRACCGPTLT